MIGLAHIIPFGKTLLDLIYAKRDNERLKKENEELKKKNKRLDASNKRMTKLLK